MHEKGLQRQISIGTLVNSQERRAAVVLRTNRLSTASFAPPSVLQRISFVRASEDTFRTVSSMPWKAQGAVVGLWANRPVGVPSYPVPPRPAAPSCAAPPRPARGMSGFWTRQVPDIPAVFQFEDQSENRDQLLTHQIITCRIQTPDIPRAGRDGAGHGGTAGRGGDGQDGTPTGRSAQETTVPLTLQTIEESPPGRLSGSTNKGNPL